jgi:hypothetical protein
MWYSTMYWCSRGIHVMFYDIFYDVHVAYMWCSIIYFCDIHVVCVWYIHVMLYDVFLCSCSIHVTFYDFLWCLCDIHMMFYDIFCNVHIVYMWYSRSIQWCFMIYFVMFMYYTCDVLLYFLCSHDINVMFYYIFSIFYFVSFIFMFAFYFSYIPWYMVYTWCPIMYFKMFM